jgi:LysR family hydrogen peroxide-inducible transcriptional activator
MELRQLRYLCAVVDHGTFTAAAQQCAIAQPSLCQQIQSLEEELGQPLLVRHPRKVTLTQAGEMVVKRARLILQETGQLRADMERRTGLLEGNVEVGVIPTMAPYVVPQRVKAFLKFHPGVQIQIRERRTSRIIDDLVAGNLDFGIISDITTSERQRYSLWVKELLRERLQVAIPEGHRLAKAKGPVDMDQLPKEEIIVLGDGHCLGDQTLSVCRIRRSPDRLECEQIETLFAMVAAGLGLAIVPEMASQRHIGSGVVVKPFRSPEPTRAINLIKRRSATLSPAAEALLSFFEGS